MYHNRGCMETFLESGGDFRESIYCLTVVYVDAGLNYSLIVMLYIVVVV